MSEFIRALRLNYSMLNYDRQKFLVKNRCLRLQEPLKCFDDSEHTDIVLANALND